MPQIMVCNAVLKELQAGGKRRRSATDGALEGEACAQGNAHTLPHRTSRPVREVHQNPSS